MAQVKAKIEWANNGEPVDGKYIATIEVEGVNGVQRFEGGSYREVADKLLSAQANATHKIKSLAGERKPVEAAPSKAITPVPLTAVDRVNIARDITNPETAPEAVKKVVESVVGSLDQVRNQLNADTEEKDAEAAQDAAYGFAQETPEYMVCTHNVKTMIRYMQMHNMDPKVKENYVLAFDQLKEAGLVVLKPSETPAPTPEAGGLPEPTAEPTETTRPRGATATGLRSVDSTVPTRTTAKPKYTRQEIDAMPIGEYDNKMKFEPGFRQLVDALFGQKAATT